MNTVAGQSAAVPAPDEEENRPDKNSDSNEESPEPDLGLTSSSGKSRLKAQGHSYIEAGPATAKATTKCSPLCSAPVILLSAKTDNDKTSPNKQQHQQLQVQLNSFRVCQDIRMQQMPPVATVSCLKRSGEPSKRGRRLSHRLARSDAVNGSCLGQSNRLLLWLHQHRPALARWPPKPLPRLLLVLILSSSNLFRLSIVDSKSYDANFNKLSANEHDQIKLGQGDVLLQTNRQGIFRGSLISGGFEPLSRNWPATSVSGFGDDDKKSNGDNEPSQDLSVTSPNSGVDFDGGRKSAGGDMVVAFLGIRYASAPIKRLRFMPPTAFHYHANQVHDARSPGPICPQAFPLTNVASLRKLLRAAEKQQQQQWQRNNSSQMMKVVNNKSEQQIVSRLMSQPDSLAEPSLEPLMRQLQQMEQSEDCLNLNIYTRIEAILSKVIGGGSSYQKALNDRMHSARGPLPVLIVIHGDSFDYGSGSTINGLQFVSSRQLLVITLNYRLNILGFPPKLAGASRGNLGLMDQVAALHWIKDNVASFGGSPNNITLMGTKRGAIFVNLLMISPLAKGLFQRAIMEDGSALTPLVAYHIQQHPGAPSQAIQHLRLLAKLCDCPSSKQTAQVSAANSSSLSSLAVSFTSAATDDTNANSQMFECLREKPVEQITRFQPNGLINLNHITGQLTMLSKVWLNYQRLTSIINSVSKNQQQENQIDIDQGDSVGLQASQVNEFLAQIVALPATILNLTHHNVNVTSTATFRSLALELLETVYSNKHKSYTDLSGGSLQPLFGPIIDGTIVPDEDIALAMLRTSGQPSNFGQRHLLIGLTKSLRVHSTSMSSLHNPLGHLLADRLTPNIQQSGLTSEEAVDIINAFVRSFYRFHNQEITNSIISQYLNSIVMTRFRKQRKLSYNNRNNSIDFPHSDRDNEQLNSREQQLIVLDAIMEAFNDALVSVPLIKTALIHATKQLEPLVEPFVGQQFERWKRDYQYQQNQQSANNSNVLLESFIVFAQSLYADRGWPLELQTSYKHQPDQLNQPKATYMYQFDLNWILEKISLVESKLDQIASSPLNSIAIWNALKIKLFELKSRLESGDLVHRLSIGCELDGSLWAALAQEGPLATRLINWICGRFSTTLEDFVKDGKLIGRSRVDFYANFNDVVDRIKRFSARGACRKQVIAIIDGQPGEAAVDPEVAIVIEPNEYVLTNISRDCLNQIENFAFEFLASELSNGSGDLDNLKQSVDDHWSVFDVFSQQIASSPIRSSDRRHLGWQMNQLSELNSGLDNGQDSILARTSFWSNFISALNCSKTQPINPLSLIGLGNSHSSWSLGASKSSSLNSTLMNINLVYTCQGGQFGPRTIREIIENMVTNIKNELQNKIDHWLSLKSSSVQNHHSLRMANLSQSNSMLVELENLEGNQQVGSSSTIGSEFYSNASSAANSIETGNEGDLKQSLAHRINASISAEGRIGYIALVACAILITITFFGVLFKNQRKNRIRRKQVIKSNIHPGSSIPVLSSDSNTGQTIQNGANKLEFRELFVQEDIVHGSGFVHPLQMITETSEKRPIENGRHTTGDSGHVYAIEQTALENVDQSRANITAYWTLADNGLNNNGNKVNLCRSHSSVSMSNGSTIVENLHKLAENSSRNGEMQIIDSKDSNNKAEEVTLLSMMVPPEETQQASVIGYQPAQVHKRSGSCLLLSNGSSLSGTGPYGESSGGETQNQSSLSSSQTTSNIATIGNHQNGTIKKRVKIRDPPTRESTLEKRGGTSHASVAYGTIKQPQQQQQQQQHFCPVHNPYGGSQEALQHSSVDLGGKLIGGNNGYYIEDYSQTLNQHPHPHHYQLNSDVVVATQQYWPVDAQLINGNGAYGQQIVLPIEQHQVLVQQMGQPANKASVSRQAITTATTPANNGYAHHNQQMNHQMHHNQ